MPENTSIKLAEGTLAIADNAFSGFSGLTSVTIPNSVTSISYSAFSNCSGLTSVYIGKNVTLILSNAFSGCKNLENVYCLAENVPNTQLNAFEESYLEYATLHVPQASINEYLMTSPWSSFENIVGIVVDQDNPTETKTFEFRYEDKSIPDDTIITFNGKKHIIKPQYEYKTNDILSLYNLTGEAIKYSASIEVIENTMNAYDTQICMGGQCNVFGGSTFTFNAAEALPANGSAATLFDAYSKQTTGHMLTKLTATSGAESHSVYIRFEYVDTSEPSCQFIFNDTTIRSKQSLLLPVALNNESEITALQCNIYLPEGISLHTNRGKYDITLDENRIVDHTVSSALQEDGSIKMYVVSLSNSLFEGDNGNLFYLNLKADEGFTGEAIVSIKNIVASAADGTRYDLEDATAKITVKPYTLGDVNDDGQVIVNDVVLTINYALGTKVEDFVFEAADINGDGEIVVDDIVKIINIILGVNTASEAPMHRAEAQGEADKFYISDFNIAAGESKALAIQLESNNTGSDPAQLNYVAFQFDIYLPEGLKVDMKRGKYNFAFNEARKDDHTLTFADQADGAIRVIGASLSNGYFWETSGDFVTFSVTAEDGFTGAKQLYLKNIKFSTKAGERADLEDVTVNINNDATGIENISSETGLNGNVYSIQGQKVSNAGNTNSLPRGLYIINGKKVVKK